MYPDRPKAADIGGVDRGYAADRADSAALVVFGQSGGFQPDDRLYQRRFVGHHTECIVFLCGVFVLSQVSAYLDCALCEFRGLACGGSGSSVAAQQVNVSNFYWVGQGLVGLSVLAKIGFGRYYEWK